MSPLEASARRPRGGRSTPPSPLASLAVVGACAVVGALVLRALRTRRTPSSRLPALATPSSREPDRHRATARRAAGATSDEALAERNDRYAG